MSSPTFTKGNPHISPLNCNKVTYLIDNLLGADLFTSHSTVNAHHLFDCCLWDPPPQKKNVIPEQPNIYLSHLYFWIERFSSIQHDLKFQINVTSYIKKINLMDFKVTEITEFTEIFDAFWDFSSLKRTFTW